MESHQFADHTQFACLQEPSRGAKIDEQIEREEQEELERKGKA